MPRAALALLLIVLGGCAARMPRADLPPLRVGSTGDYAPFSIRAEGEFSGLDIEIARRFAKDTGRRLEFVWVRWADLLRDLEAGRFDVAMSGVTIRPERALVGTFTRPITTSGAVVLVRPEIARSAVRLDLMGMRLGVNAGGYLEQVAHRLFPTAILVLSPDNQSLPQLLRRGSVEALLTDDLEADAFSRNWSQVRRVGPLTQDRKAFLARDATLAADLDEWLRARDADGTLAALRLETLGPDRTGPQSRFESDLEALLALVDLRLAFMPLVAAAKARTGQAVEDPAQEARVLDAAGATATRVGLDPATAVRLFRAQMTAGRAVQRQYLATAPAQRPPAAVVSLEGTLRPALAALSSSIVERAATVASDQTALRTLDRTQLAGRLDTFLTPAPERKAIADAIVGLRPH